MKSRVGRLVCQVAVILTAECHCALLTPAQEQTSPSPAEAASTRACTANPVLTYKPSKKNAKKLKHPLTPDPAPTCIEIKGDALGIQEFLQNVAREENWRVGENRASEDMWSFIRYFNADELEAYADTKVAIEPVNFTSGKAAATVRTTDIGGGYVRVQISAHFQGEGKSTDPSLKQPATVWPLNSKGVFEQQFVSVLQTRYKPLD